MTRGERVKIISHYDLLGDDVYGCSGIFISIDENTLNALIYFPDFEEWGEIPEGDFERVKPDHVTKKDSKFVSRVKKLEYSS